ncbi:MAG: hypothetical protein ACP5K7_11160 [Verrucomicrobiia bacterium]|jgi:preprotein translocase subunit SecG
MMEKVLFWAVLIWMIALLILGIIAVKDIWKDAVADDQSKVEGDSSDNLTDNETASKSESQVGGQGATSSQPPSV